MVPVTNTQNDLPIHKKERHCSVSLWSQHALHQAEVKKYPILRISSCPGRHQEGTPSRESADHSERRHRRHLLFASGYRFYLCGFLTIESLIA